MALTFIQDHNFMGKLNHSVVKWYDVIKTFAMVDNVKERVAEEFREYGAYGYLAHLLFLYINCRQCLTLPIAISVLLHASLDPMIF